MYHEDKSIRFNVSKEFYNWKRGKIMIKNDNSFNASEYPVTEPTKFERVLFDAGLPVKTNWAGLAGSELADPVTCDSDWTIPAAWNHELDARRRDDWGDLYPVSWPLGEWYAHLFRDAKRILDIGTQDGRPSLFLSKYVPEVVAIDVCGVDLALAVKAAEIGGIRNVTFQIADAHDLPFEDGSFDGACFGASFGYPGTDPHRMLCETRRVLRPGSVLAFKLFLTIGYGKGDNSSPYWDRRTYVLVEQGRPLIQTCINGGHQEREYKIWLKPDSDLGQRILKHCQIERTALGSVRDDVLACLCSATLPLDAIAAVQYAVEDIHIDPKSLYGLLCETGFQEITSWALPEASRFSEALNEMGLLNRIGKDDLQPYLRALARSAFCLEGVRTNLVSCVRQ